MSLPWFLPLAKGWRYKLDMLRYGVDPAIPIPPQETVELIAPEEPVAGWFMGAGIAFDHEMGVASAEVDTWSAGASPYWLNFMGYIQYMTYGVWCPRFDPAGKIFVVNVEAGGGVPYLTKFRVFVSNPLEDTVIHVLTYGMASIRIEDKALFEQSVLRYAASTPDIIAAIRELKEALRGAPPPPMLPT